MNLLEYPLGGNLLLDWLIAFGIAAIISIVLFFLKRLVASRLARFAERTATDIDDLVASLLDRINPIFLLITGLYSGSWWLSLSSDSRVLTDNVFFVAVMFQLGLSGGRFLGYLLKKTTRLREYDDPAAQTSLSVLGFLSRLLLWSILFLIVLDNLGVNITALIASMGIGGIAVALAAQSILGELFASLSIAIDKPFVIGDFIVIDGFAGSIEKIGMRTTQIRSLGGELIVFSNTDLLKSRMRNFKRMQERRILFTLDVVYGTPASKVERIPAIVREIIEAEETMARFDRAHFKGYGPSSLVFEFVYYVLSREYNDYMDVQQRINLSIYRRFESEGIGFAFPTQTLHIGSVPPSADTDTAGPAAPASRPSPAPEHPGTTRDHPTTAQENPS
jgi:small-conductance mechanosensitive channel